MLLLNTQNWYQAKLNIPLLRARGLDGTGMYIGHLDTGIQANHPALLDKVTCYQIINEEDELEVAPLIDRSGHGTEMAQIIAEVAPKAHLFAAQTLQAGKDILHTLLALNWLGQEADCRIICLPMGIKRYSPIFEPMLQMLEQKGKLVICAIGNDGFNNFRYPGASRYAFTVGAFDSNEEVPHFSGTYWDHINGLCLKPDVLAPGVDIHCLDKQAQPSLQNGTSPATAIVAGIAALLWQAYPEASVQQIKGALAKSAKMPEEQDYGSRFGNIQPMKALQLLESSTIQTPEVQHNTIARYVDYAFSANLKRQAADTPLQGIIYVGDQIQVSTVLEDVHQNAGLAPQKVRSFATDSMSAVTAIPAFWHLLLKHPNVWQVSGVEG